MNRDQRLFLVAVGEASAWDSLLTRIETACSAKTRVRGRQYGAIRGVFGAALSDPDDRITVRFQRKVRPDPRVLAGSALLGLLTVVLLLEWGTYTFPAIFQYMSYVAHRCGIP